MKRSQPFARGNALSLRQVALMGSVRRRSTAGLILLGGSLCLVSLQACSATDEEPVKTLTQRQVAAWTAGASYAAGAFASYQGTTYECLQSHTSLGGWEPPNVPALWQVVATAAPQDVCDESPAQCCPQGTELLALSAGADNFSSSSAGKCVAALGGNDTVFLNSGHPTTLMLGAGNDTAMSGSGNDAVLGGYGNDTIHAYGGTNFLAGGFGNDTLSASGGQNTVHPGPGADTVHLGPGDDTLIIANICEIAWGDTFDGGGGHNTLRTPVPLEELQQLGVTVAHFDSIVIDDTRSCYSECSESACVTPDESDPEIVPADLGEAPELNGVADLDSFLVWFYRIRKGEIDEAREAIAGVTNNADVVAGVMQRFETARTGRSLGKALMLLALVGAMESPQAESALLSLLNQPILQPVNLGDPSTRYNDEVSYRRNAIFALSGRGSQAATAAIRDAAINHVDVSVRSTAIQTVIHGMSPSERSAFRTEVRPDDRFFVDRPNSTDPDFDERYQAMQQNYAQ